MNTLFPVFLVADKLHFLIVGGGNVALEKLQALTRQSPKATIRLVAPQIKSEIFEWSKNYEVEIIQTKFSKELLINIQIAFICTDLPQTNADIRNLCIKEKILVNVADTPDLCDFYLGSIVTKNDLKIAISTNGKSPTFAKRLKELLQSELPNEIQENLENLNAIRQNLKGDFLDKVKKLNEITTVLLKK